MAYVVITKKDMSTYELPFGSFIGTAGLAIAFWGHVLKRCQADSFKVADELTISVARIGIMKLIGSRVLADYPLGAAMARRRRDASDLRRDGIADALLDGIRAPSCSRGVFLRHQGSGGATRLEVNLTSEFDLDLYVRYERAVDYGDAGQVLADYRSETVGGNERCRDHWDRRWRGGTLL